MSALDRVIRPWIVGGVRRINRRHEAKVKLAALRSPRPSEKAWFLVLISLTVVVPWIIAMIATNLAIDHFFGGYSMQNRWQVAASVMLPFALAAAGIYYAARCRLEVWLVRRLSPAS